MIPLLPDMTRQTGVLKQTSVEGLFKWRIANYFAMKDECYLSPCFKFLDASWCLGIFPNGNSIDGSVGHVGIFLIRKDKGSEISLKFKIKIDGENSRLVFEKSTDYDFDNENDGWGWPRFIPASTLLRLETSAVPLGALTLLCHMENIPMQSK